MTRRRIEDQRIEQALAGYEAAIRTAFLQAVRTAASGIDLNALIEALERGDIDGAAQIATISRAVLYPVDAAITGAFVASGTSIAASAPVWAASFGFDGRAREAEAWSRDHVGGLITQIIEDQRAAIQTVIADNIGAGVNTRKAAIEIAGRIGVNGRREGGIVGLNGPQMQALGNVRLELSLSPRLIELQKLRLLELPKWQNSTLAELDAKARKDVLSRYFTRELRDKRFDGLVRKAIAAGKPISQVDIDRISQRYSDKALLYRANMIARTESITALRVGRRQGIDQAIAQGAISEDRISREWDSSGDGRVRKDHRRMDGKRINSMSEPWVLPDGSRMLYPGDTSLGARAEQTIQCRCTERFVVDWLRA